MLGGRESNRAFLMGALFNGTYRAIAKSGLRPVLAIRLYALLLHEFVFRNITNRSAGRSSRARLGLYRLERAAATPALTYGPRFNEPRFWDLFVEPSICSRARLRPYRLERPAAVLTYGPRFNESRF